MIYACIIAAAAAAHLQTFNSSLWPAPLFISVIFLFVLINLIGGSVAGGVMFLQRCSSAVVERRKHKKREI